MRRGFTLIEMLVATALVMLIMILFAEVFKEAVGTVRTQRGLIANDEKARAFMQALGTDLSRRTYRSSVGRGASVLNAQGIMESPPGIVALAPNDRVDPRQLGYFYFSENDPRDDTDDVLSLTVSVDETLRNPLVSDPSSNLYTGRAAVLLEDLDRDGTLDAGEDINGDSNLNIYPNQPDLDDGRSDSASASRAAEVTYFLRGTTLYRRVMLLRDPLPNSPPFSTQPTLPVTGDPLLATVPSAIVPNALQYRDFDFAATNIDGRLHFHGLESLDNSRGIANSPLAMPFFRYGFNPSSGLPVELTANGYFGRFTQEETSHQTANGLGQTGFRWPGINDGAGSNIIDSPLVLSPQGVVAVDTNTNGTYETGTDVDLLGPRAGEDILLTGVETFNIEVWDTEYGEFDADGDTIVDAAEDPNGNGVFDGGIWVDLGNNFGRGLWTQTWTAGPGISGNATWGRQNTAYGPGAPANNNVYDTWHTGLQAALGVTPFRPLQRAPSSGVAWAPNSAPPAPPTSTIIFPDAANNQSIGYVVTNADGVRQTGAREPEWPREPGALIRDGQIIWQCFDNRIGLEKIRITIRFRDTGTGQARQVSLIHAFTE